MLFVFALGCGVGLFIHDLLTVTDHLNHVVIINRSSAILERLTVKYAGELSGTWILEKPEILPGDLSVYSFPRAFSDSGDLWIAHSKGQFHAEIDDMGRFGHSLVIELADKDIAVYWDGVARPVARVPIEAK